MRNFEPSVGALRLFVKIVETGKLTSAADQLHMSQSAASHALRVLEAQVGARLFVRERDGLRLSEAGQKSLPRIEAALSSLDTLRSELTGLKKLEVGSLRVCAVPSLLATVLPALLREYANRFPGIELSIFEGTDDEVQMWVQTGLAHVGFAALPIEGVEAEELSGDEWFALVSPRDFVDKSTVTLRELSSRRFLMSGGGCERHIQRLFAAAGVELMEPMTVKQMPTIQAMVAEGLGVSLVPALSLGPARGCRSLPLKPRLFRRIGMVRSINSTPSPALEAWMSLVRSRLNTTSKRTRQPPRVAKAKGVRQIRR